MTATATVIVIVIVNFKNGQKKTRREEEGVEVVWEEDVIWRQLVD